VNEREASPPRALLLNPDPLDLSHGDGILAGESVYCYHVLGIRNKGIQMRAKLTKGLLPLLVLFLVSCASGSAIVTGTKRAPREPSQVKLYLEEPTNYDVIGIVNASSDSGWTEQESQDYAIQELKKQAGKLGANGILLGSTGNATSGYVFSGNIAVPVTAKTVSGRAIFVSVH